ncbi:hypothetical protein IscW_ISCW013156 [Ixodes scapularis]|uniref:Uncharacterized protein n=1 Tax=Ixodes scapularis TaxID=6945 RepID=B7QF07_IXOSC|nr:hypothetical protein IscW_ISCW013156 [Ixodes scapularis]|eukprot:XP_002414121.1 hypothetical protein IscW_ISCW013156 [Ixodes scapularis]
MSHFRRAFVTFARRTRSFPYRFPCRIAVLVPEIVLGPEARGLWGQGVGARRIPLRAPWFLPDARTQSHKHRRQTGRGFAKNASQGDGD